MYLIELPGSKKLKEEIEALRKKLADLVFEKDELVYDICPDIKTKYMLEIGVLEYKVYELYCSYLRFRRKKTLIQKNINRQEKVDLKQIDKELDTEFEKYQDKLNSRLDDINEALERKSAEVLTVEETKEIKALYRKIVKLLHPDLNLNLTKNQKNLFHKAVKAYEDGDLASMRLIMELVDNDLLDEIELGNSLTELNKQKNRLKSLVDKLQDEITEIKTTYPYTLKIYLEDEAKKKERINELNKQLVSYEAAVKTLKEAISSLLEGLDE